MLANSELLASSTVANATMNRGRGLSGVNSYARELRFDIPGFLQARVAECGLAVWCDVCCGEGRALAEAGEQLGHTEWGHKVRMIGVDLVDLFAAAPTGVEFIAADTLVFTPDQPVDLITNVHGLHYLGDKLKFVEQAYQQLTPGGMLLAHLGTANIRTVNPTPLWPKMARRLRSAGITFSLQQHILSLTRTNALLDFGAAYQGAGVSTEPNYTGITVIDSWYTIP